MAIWGSEAVCKALAAKSCGRAMTFQALSHVPLLYVQAVFTSLTAVKRSKSSLSSLDVDSAVDFVFSSVFSREVLSAMTDEHEWI